MAFGGIDALDENVVQGGRVINVCDFAWFCRQTIRILHRSRGDRLTVTQDYDAHVANCLAHSFLFKKVADDLDV